MAAEKKTDKGGGMSMAQNAIAFLVAGLIAGGVGAFQGMQVKPAEPVKASAKPEDEKRFAPIVEMATLDVPPVVTNLAAPPDVWIRIEGSILFEGKLPHGEALVGQISSDLLAFMRTQTLQQIQGVAGLQHLRQDLNERVSTRTDGKVREYIIKSLVVQ
jgi:flagellar FliL protein